MNEIHLSCIYPGHAVVNRGDHEIGEVNRIDWPSQRENGEIIVKQVWDVCSVGKEATERLDSLSVFDTRREAVAYLAAITNYKLSKGNYHG